MDKAHQMKIAELVGKACVDEAMKTKLIGNPKKMLTGAGVPIPEDMEVKVYSNTKNEYHLVVPLASFEGSTKVEKISQDSSLQEMAAFIITQVQKGGESRDKMMKDPISVLKAQGITPPAGLKLSIHENTKNLFQFVIPRKINENEELNELEMKQVAGGKGSSSKGFESVSSYTTEVGIAETSVFIVAEAILFAT